MTDHASTIGIAVGRLNDGDVDGYITALYHPHGRFHGFPDVPVDTRNWWLVITDGDVDVCDVDPGYPVAASLTATLRRMVEIWRGDLGWSDALRSGALEVHGAAAMRRAVPEWFTLSAFATVPRPNATHAGGAPTPVA